MAALTNMEASQKFHTSKNEEEIKTQSNYLDSEDRSPKSMDQMQTNFKDQIGHCFVFTTLTKYGWAGMRRLTQAVLRPFPGTLASCQPGRVKRIHYELHYELHYEDTEMYTL